MLEIVIQRNAVVDNVVDAMLGAGLSTFSTTKTSVINNTKPLEKMRVINMSTLSEEE